MQNLDESLDIIWIYTIRKYLGLVSWTKADVVQNKKDYMVTTLVFVFAHLHQLV